MVRVFNRQSPRNCSRMQPVTDQAPPGRQQPSKPRDCGPGSSAVNPARGYDSSRVRTLNRSLQRLLPTSTPPNRVWGSPRSSTTLRRATAYNTNSLCLPHEKQPRPKKECPSSNIMRTTRYLNNHSYPSLRFSDSLLRSLFRSLLYSSSAGGSSPLPKSQR